MAEGVDAKVAVDAVVVEAELVAVDARGEDKLCLSASGTGLADAAKGVVKRTLSKRSRLCASSEKTCLTMPKLPKSHCFHSICACSPTSSLICLMASSP